MNKKDKALLIRCFKEYDNQYENSGLANIYKSWSERKNESYYSLKKYYRDNYTFHDLRVLHGNGYFYTTGTIAQDSEYNTYFIVDTAYTKIRCLVNNNQLIDENTGEIFFIK